MAYLDLTQSYDIGAVVAGKAMADADTATLSPLEWSVVALAQRDRLSSLNKPGRVALAMGRLFGSRPNPELADAKLEALRRIAVLAWHRGYAIASHEIRAFKAAGFTLAQYELVLASISRSRNARNNQRAHV
ncbi:hypothetical protein [Stakelama saccharophila]|uniref:Uncharacterized protein n=1 Tax=Stakelama saccharophila TaxID=3075605 RepID=A0ABZ0B669_9SPHN|nr:hypothetical protein [Stakelama sp. W311]WNO52897.1 hypothetical protein RPR59_10555 [Stakelama sp. W311]